MFISLVVTLFLYLFIYSANLFIHVFVLQPAWLQEPAWLVSAKSLRGSAVSGAAGACVAHRHPEPAGLISLRGCQSRRGSAACVAVECRVAGHPEPAGLSSLRGCRSPSASRACGARQRQWCRSPMALRDSSPGCVGLPPPPMIHDSSPGCVGLPPPPRIQILCGYRSRVMINMHYI